MIISSQTTLKNRSRKRTKNNDNMNKVKVVLSEYAELNIISSWVRKELMKRLRTVPGASLSAPQRMRWDKGFVALVQENPKRKDYFCDGDHGKCGAQIVEVDSGRPFYIDFDCDENGSPGPELIVYPDYQETFVAWASDQE